MQKNIITKESDKKRRESQELEKNWREIEKAADYLVKTSQPGLSWRELLGRNNETDHRLKYFR